MARVGLPRITRTFTNSARGFSCLFVRFVAFLFQAELQKNKIKVSRKGAETQREIVQLFQLCGSA